MAIIESGIYRIVNVGRKTAITVPAGNPGAIVNWETPNQPGQQWLVRCFGRKYHILDCVYGRYIVVDSPNPKPGTRAHLGCYPTQWEIMPASGTTWKIKLADYDLALDSYGSSNGDTINLLYSCSVHLDTTWRFERLGDEPPSVQFGTAEEDQIITRLIEQLAQKNKQLAEQASRIIAQDQRIEDQNQTIADQTQRIADQSSKIVNQTRKIEDQARELGMQRKQIEERDQQLAWTNREARYQLAQRKEPLDHVRVARAHSPGGGETAQGEVALLRAEVAQLKGLMNQFIDKDHKRPNNMT